MFTAFARRTVIGGLTQGFEIMPGTDGLCHISELANGRVEKTEDVVKKGDIVRVKLLSIDDRGRMKLSRKVLLEEES